MNIILIAIGENISTLEKNYLIIKGLVKNNVNVFPFHFAYDINIFYNFLKSYKTQNFNWELLGILFKGNTKLQKLLNNAKICLSLFYELKRLTKKTKIDAIIIPIECITEMLISLKIFSKLYSVPLVGNIMEYGPALPSYKNFRTKIRWKLLLKFCDAYIVISKWLMNKLSIYKKPLFYLPVIFDPDMIDDLVNNKIISNFYKNNLFSKKPVLIYSSSNAYTDLLDFSLKALSFLKHQDFLFVITGNYREDQKKYWLDFIKNIGLENKVFFSGYLSETELFALMKQSTALLIPLLNNARHQARFPQKILDYIYLEKPIISTKVGEIDEHFIDGETAFLAKNVTPKSYSQKIKFVLDNLQKANMVAKKAKEYIVKKFHFVKCTKELKIFLNKLKDSNIKNRP